MDTDTPIAPQSEHEPDMPGEAPQDRATPADANDAVGAAGESTPDPALHLPFNQKQTIDSQEAFCARYAKTGTIKVALQELSVDRRTITDWQSRDYLGFRARFLEAKATWAERLENILFTRLDDKKCNPLLLIFAIKAHLRDKYGDAPVMSEDQARDVLGHLRKLTERKVKAPDTAKPPTSKGILAQVDQILTRGSAEPDST